MIATILSDTAAQMIELLETKVKEWPKNQGYLTMPKNPIQIDLTRNLGGAEVPRQWMRMMSQA